MPTQTERERAQASLASFGKALASKGFTGDVKLTHEVVEFIDENPDIFEDGTKSLYLKAVKALSAEISPDGTQALVSWSEGEASMDEDEPAPAPEDAKRLFKLERKVDELGEKMRRDTQLRNTPRVEVKLPGQSEWEARKSRGQTKFRSAEHAHDFGLYVLSQISPSLVGSRAAEASKSLKDKYGTKAQQTSPLGDGGATIAQVLMNEVLTTFDEYGVARNHLRVVSMPKGNASFMEDKNGISASYTGEGATITASDIDWGTVDLRAKKLALRTILTSEIIQDSAINMAEHVARRFTDATQQKEDEALFLGDGTATYGGINGLKATFSAKASNYRNVTASTASTTHTLAQINELMAKMPARYRKGAAFHCHSAMTSYIFDRLAGSVGGVQWQEVVGYGFVKTFLGVPIVENFVMNSDPALSGDVVDVYYANFGEAGFFGDTRSLEIRSSDIPLMASDQTLVVGTRRYDINLWNLGSANSQSPVVALWQD